jgi:hypothetical protein
MASMTDSSATSTKHRIYCETLPYEVVTRPRTVALLRRYELEIVLAVRPWQLRELPGVARVLTDAGVPVSVWPMLADDEGRWASAHNAASFVRFLRDTTDALDAAGVAPREVLLDLEPPFAHARALAVGAGSEAEGITSRARALFGLGLRRAPGPETPAGANELGAAVAELHARGTATASAVWPLVALDPPGARGWQALLGTPVDALATGRVSVMMYTSILEGWSRGAIRRRDATALLAAATARAATRWGGRAGMSLGCVGAGALVDEPVYRDPSELAEDSALARAAGCHDLTLFELGGVLAREPAESWLDAFVYGAEAGAVRSSCRVHAARRLARLATWALRGTKT